MIRCLEAMIHGLQAMIHGCESMNHGFEAMNHGFEPIVSLTKLNKLVSGLLEPAGGFNKLAQDEVRTMVMMACDPPSLISGGHQKTRISTWWRASPGAAFQSSELVYDFQRVACLAGRGISICWLFN